MGTTEKGGGENNGERGTRTRACTQLGAKQWHSGAWAHLDLWCFLCTACPLPTGVQERLGTSGIICRNQSMMNYVGMPGSSKVLGNCPPCICSDWAPSSSLYKDLSSVWKFPIRPLHRTVCIFTAANTQRACCCMKGTDDDHVRPQCTLLANALWHTFGIHSQLLEGITAPLSRWH